MWGQYIGPTQDPVLGQYIGPTQDPGRKTYGYENDSQRRAKVADHCFCAFFTFELMARFLAFAKKRSCIRDGWFKFDSVLVGLMILETWIMPFVGGGGAGMGQASMLRLLRLLRLKCPRNFRRKFLGGCLGEAPPRKGTNRFRLRTNG